MCDKTIIGIDPGVNNGVAIFIDKKYYLSYSCDFWELLKQIDRLDNINTFSLVEDPNLNPPVFCRGLKNKPNLKVAQNVWANKMIATLIMQYLKSSKIAYKSVKPDKKKIDGNMFKRITGKIKSNQHERDATMLVLRSGLV